MASSTQRWRTGDIQSYADSASSEYDRGIFATGTDADFDPYKGVRVGEAGNPGHRKSLRTNSSPRMWLHSLSTSRSGLSLEKR